MTRELPCAGTWPARDDGCWVVMMLEDPPDDLAIIRTWVTHPNPWARWARWGDGLLCPAHVETRPVVLPD